jgi:hypothetical protein
MTDSVQGLVTTPFGSTGQLHENVNIKYASLNDGNTF